jgi:queuine tRNA-ribosyltransferase
MHYQIENFPNGQASLRDLNVNETMHSLIGPWEEAQLIYIQQSQLKKRFQNGGGMSGPLVIFDVGLGIAANALGAIEEFLGTNPQCDLQIISFENQTEGLKYALGQVSNFPFLERHQESVRKLLADGEVHFKKADRTLRWQLVQGDFLKTALTIQSSPDLIFYDFYSPRVCPELWGIESFRLLYLCTEERRKLGMNTLILTYSSSTSMRCAMILAGFYVGYGISTPGKWDTTVASTYPHSVQNPLGEEWLARWSRSSNQVPTDYSVQNRKIILETLKGRIIRSS